MTTYSNLRLAQKNKNLYNRDPLSPLPPLVNQLQTGQPAASAGQPATSPGQLPSEQVHALLGQFNQNHDQLDHAGKAKLNDVNKKSDSLLKSSGLLRQSEMQHGMKAIFDEVVEFPWNTHIIKPGSNPGDIIDDKGIQKLRTADGSLEPLAYTADYVKQNTIPLPGTGQLAVPVSPKDGYKLVKIEPRDIVNERNEIDKADKGIQTIYDDYVKHTLKGREVKDEKGKSLGFPSLTDKERQDLNVRAADAYVKQQLQAKHAAKTITDAGAAEFNQLIKSNTIDPFRYEQESNRPPQPSPSPVPVVPSVPMKQELPPELAALINGKESAEERLKRATEYAKLKQLQDSTVKSGNFSSQLVEGGMMRDTLTAPTKNDMKKMYETQPDGIVVSLPDGRRYLKDDGKFWQIPWNYHELRSSVAVDDNQEPIIDPKTGKPAAGVVQQLEAGKGGQLIENPFVQSAAGGEQQSASRVGETTENKPQAPKTRSLSTRSQVAATLDQGTQFDSKIMSQTINKHIENIETRKSLLNPMVLTPGQDPKTLADGVAFVDENGEIWLKVGNNAFEGPFRQSDIHAHVNKRIKRVESHAAPFGVSAFL